MDAIIPFPTESACPAAAASPPPGLEQIQREATAAVAEARAIAVRCVAESQLDAQSRIASAESQTLTFQQQAQTAVLHANAEAQSAILSAQGEIANTQTIAQAQIAATQIQANEQVTAIRAEAVQSNSSMRQAALQEIANRETQNDELKRTLSELSTRVQTLSVSAESQQMTIASQHQLILQLQSQLAFQANENLRIASSLPSVSAPPAGAQMSLPANADNAHGFNANFQNQSQNPRKTHP